MPRHAVIKTGILAAGFLFAPGCGNNDVREVVVYTSLDQVFSEPVLKDFEKESGIKVKAVYDVEAAKTTGLVNRLIAEKDNPRADVFWNSEIGRTIVLKKKGVLAPYSSAAGRTIPEEFRDRDGCWTGFAARARVLVYNKNLVNKNDVPGSIFELTAPKWKNKVAIANPIFGTTAAQAAAIFAVLGEEKAREYFAGLKANGIVVVDGNSTARDRVTTGLLPIAFTDTDDVNVALLEGKPVGMVFPDREGIGTLLIPNTVCLIKNCPHPENGKKLIDYLLSEEVESRLAFSGSLQIPLRDGVKRPPETPSAGDFKLMAVDYETIAGQMEKTGKILQEILLR